MMTTRKAAEALLKHYENEEPPPEHPNRESWIARLNKLLESLGIALANDEKLKMARDRVTLAEADVLKALFQNGDVKAARLALKAAEKDLHDLEDMLDV
jgi:hypothetical protein